MIMDFVQYSDQNVSNGLTLNELAERIRTRKLLPFLLKVKTQDSYQFTVKHEGRLFGEINIVFSDIEIDEIMEPRISHIQLTNRQGRTLLLHEFTSGVRVINSLSADLTYFPEEDLINIVFDLILDNNLQLDLHILVSLLHEFGHAFDNTESKEAKISRIKEGILGYGQDTEITYKDLLNSINYICKGENSLITLDEVLGEFTQEEADEVYNREVRASNYAVQRIQEILIFLEIDDPNLIDSMHRMLGNILALVNIWVNSCIGRSLKEILHGEVPQL